MARKTSSAENLFLTRKRLGQTQKQAAKYFQVGISRYRAWELGENTPGFDLEDPKITDVEWCVLERRRAGLNQAELAEKLKCCRYWINCMERGKKDATLLLKYWGLHNAQT